MLTKQTLVDAVNTFPEQFSVDELIEYALTIEKIQKGLKNIQEGKVNTKAEATEKLAKWLK